jgi:hypothetical protein
MRRQGMRKLLLISLLAVSLCAEKPDHGTTAHSSSNQDWSSAATTKPCKTGTTKPGTCSPGECYIETDEPANAQFFVCTSTDTWTVQDGKVEVELVVFDFATDTATGDGKYYFVVPAKLNGWNLIAVSAQVITAGTTGTTNVDLARCDVVATGNACSGTVQDMLSTNLTIDSGEGKSSTAAAAAVIDTTYDDVDTDEIIRVDVDAVHTTPAKSLILNLTFQLP